MFGFMLRMLNKQEDIMFADKDVAEIIELVVIVLRFILEVTQK